MVIATEVPEEDRGPFSDYHRTRPRNAGSLSSSDCRLLAPVCDLPDEAVMTKQRHSRGDAYRGIGLGLILIGVIFLAGAGRREPARVTGGSSAVAAPGGEISPGVAHADVDTLDLQLD
jgi:hypothetical protein